jgi:uncharacterized protein (UPF0335 family)
MAEAQKTTAAAPADSNSNSAGGLLVVDIGKRQSTKRIRQLRKGRGRLLDKINDTVQELQSKGAIKKDAQPVVIVVRKKDKKKILGF